MAASDTRISVTAEVVGTGSDGTEPSLLFTVQRHAQYSDDVKVLKRYLFNCGEGTQRLAGENGIKLSSLDAMYFTRFDVKSVGGIPGAIFALSSCGAATLQLHGPVGLSGFLGAIRSFVRRKHPQIKCVEITKDGKKQRTDTAIDYEEWVEKHEQTDQHAMIIPIELGNASVEEIADRKKCMLCDKRAPTRQRQKPKAASSNVSSNQVGRRHDNESDEHESCREWLLRFYTAKVPQKIPYVDVILNRYRGRYDDLKAQLQAKYGDLADEKVACQEREITSGETLSSYDSSSDSERDNDGDDHINYAEQPLDRRWLEKFYAEHQPDKVPHVDKVLRQFSGRVDMLKQMLLRKYSQKDTASTTDNAASTSDDNEAPRKKQKLCGVENSNEAKHVDSPAKIVAVQDNIGVCSASPPVKTTVSLCYVLQFQYEPYPVVWIIDCRTPENLSQLESRFAKADKDAHSGSCGPHSPSLVVHLSPVSVRRHSRYMQWVSNLCSSTSPPEQLIFDADALQSTAQGAFSFAFTSSAKFAVQQDHQARVKSERIDSQATQPITPMTALAKFLNESSWPALTPCQRKIVQRVDGCEREAHIAQGKLQFRLVRTKNLQLGFNYERTGWHQKSGGNEDNEAEQNPDDAASCIAATKSAVSTNISSMRKLIVLGTGSAAPSKLRASSGMYVELSGTNAANVESMLIDCGEGTYGQLWRQFGSDVSQRIGGIRCIWISHNHADHHCGLVRVLYEYWRFHVHRKDGVSPRPLVVVAPQSVLSYVESWLPKFVDNGAPQQVIQLAACLDFNDPQHPLRRRLLSEIAYSVTNIFSVRVFHCYDSYGLVLTLQGGKKLVYSGDTKPCNQLVVAGMDADLLVHEATFDDTMEEDARVKKHSTVGQALDIARRMRARQVVLTHFSQRYPSLPPPVSSNEGTSGLSSGDLDANVLCAYDGFVHPMPF